jgi:hypothetical protein
METIEIAKKLRRMAVKTDETRETRCFGCGLENGCRLHGCNALKLAADRLDRLDELSHFENTQTAAVLTQLTAERKKHEWVDARERLPEDADEAVLVIANGNPGKNIELRDAFLIGNYTPNDGWILDLYPEWERAKVSYWMPLPEAPERK